MGSSFRAIHQPSQVAADRRREEAARRQRAVASGFTTAVRRTAKALTDAPAFLRLGLMLALERRPEEATARTMFLQVREQAYEQIVASYEAYFAGAIDTRGVRSLATLAMAAADGLFIAHEIDEDVDLAASFELLAAAILGAAEKLRSPSRRPRKAATRS